MTDTSDRLCGRVDGASACADSCWRQRVGLDAEPCPMPSLSRRRRDERGSVWIGIANALCLLAIIVFGLVILAGWFDYADARSPHGKPSHGCRWTGKACKPSKPRPPLAVPTSTPTAQPTPIAPGCVEYGPDCVIDLTTGWPTVGPVVIVQTFPCPLSPLDEPEPCSPVTSTTTVAP